MSSEAATKQWIAVIFENASQQIDSKFRSHLTLGYTLQLSSYLKALNNFCCEIAYPIQ